MLTRHAGGKNSSRLSHPSVLLDDIGAFRWIIAIGHEVLWKCKGPTFGPRPGSFRAKSHGLLLALLFLQACLEHFATATGQNTTHDFFSDSNLLLQRIQRALNRSWVNPSHCLASDCDLEHRDPDLVTLQCVVRPAAFQFSNAPC